MPSEGLKAELVNRLQARLDEEEFGEVDAPESTPTPSPAKPTVETPTEKKEAPKPVKVAAPPAKSTTTAPAKTATTTTTSAPPAAAAKTTAATAASSTDAMSFEEKKKLRAQRFGIPLKQTEEERRKEIEKKKRERAERFGLPVEEDSKGKKKGGKSNKKQKTGETTGEPPKEKPLLPKEEIERQLKRGEKYGMTDAKRDELKAMLRKYRFQ